MARASAKSFRISAERESVRVDGDFSHSVRVMTDRFVMGVSRLPNDRVFDMLCIATGIYAVDRLVKRGSYAANDLGIRTLALRFAVHDLAFWSRPEIADAILTILDFLTEENWTISFEVAERSAGKPGHQYPLALSLPYQPDRVALYSGGLDSAAGLANRLIADVDRYAILTVGHQSSIRKKAIDQISDLQKLLRLEPLIHQSVIVALQGGSAIRIGKQERTQRTRSFLFCACAIAMATALNISDIDVFENGVGSINLPIMTDMLFGGLATRGSHPSLLRQISILGSAVVESAIRFNLPFARITKGEMLIQLRNASLAEWAQSSRSCIHSSWRIAGHSHCGSCPACVERRQAFAVADITENPSIYTKDIFIEPPRSGADADYFRCYLDDANTWLSEDARPRRRMDLHLNSTNVPLTEHDDIVDLHTRHCREVRKVYRC